MLAVVLGVTGQGFAASSDSAVSGVVRDAHGTPQMGALVQLLSADATAVATAFTDAHGRYLMPSVLPGRYQLRATAAFLVPVNRANVRLQAGAQAIINLTMSTLFDAESWLPAQKRRADEPVDDWKWTLRSTSNRPMLRLVDPGDGSGAVLVSSSASETHRTSSQALVAVTSGDGDFGSGGVHQVLVLNQTNVDGDSAILRVDMADPQQGFPVRPSVEATAGYERRSPLGGSVRLVSSYQSHPELTYGAGAGVQMLRMASAQQLHLGDAVLIDAGTLMEAERLASTRIVSEPFVRVVVRPDENLTVEYRFASGRTLQSSEDLDRVKPAMNVLTDAAGKPLSSKGSHNEVSINSKLGSRVVTFTAYADHFSNGAIGGSGLVARNDLQGTMAVTDPTTGTFWLAASGYGGRGVSGSVVQTITPALTAWAEYDLGSALRSDAVGAPTLSTASSHVAAHTEQAASVALRGKILRTGTSLKAEYRWQPYRTMTQVNAYNAMPEDAYLGFYLRQRVWCGHFLPEGVDAVVAATNLLEQGYQPVVAPDGHTLFLAQMPRSIQGGLAFNF